MWFCEEGRVIPDDELKAMMERLVTEIRQRFTPSIKNALLLPPDITRYHSDSGMLTNTLYHLLAPDAKVDVIPTLGQHVPHTPEQNRWMFGDIPEECIHAHDWRKSVTTIGEVPAEYVEYASDGKADWPIPVEINKAVVDPSYDVIINVGQVVPHEVLGCANHNKNYFIGLGGKGMICASHMMAACCGIENNLGQLITPLRACYNKAQADTLADIPDVFVQIVKTRQPDGKLATTGLYVGDGLETYLRAAQYAQASTITLFDTPMKKVVAIMDPDEFHSTWVANKAVYRTRMSIADGGELLIVAPGVERFGEQTEVDDLIRAYGYKGTPHVMEHYRKEPVLQDLTHGTAHLIHGSSEGRFTITYAPGKVSKEEVEQVGYQYMDAGEALAKYNPEKLRDGLQTVDGEEIFFISSPSLGLWAAKSKFQETLQTNLRFAKRMEERDPDNPVWARLQSCVTDRLALL